MLSTFREYEFANDKTCQNLQDFPKLVNFEDTGEIVDLLTIKKEEMTQEFAF